MLTIRPALRTDDNAIWSLFQSAIANGDAYVFAPETPCSVALDYWFQPGSFACVAEIHGRIVGSYVVKPNQPGLGAHVANGAYVVSPMARRGGVGRELGVHSLREAKRRNYRAMQFNAVVATNEAAIRLWNSLDFQIIGRLPGAFHHRTQGYVDLLVMFRSLETIP